MSASQFPPLQSRPSDKNCPNCSAKMALYTLPGHYDSKVEIDVCMDCSAIWFEQLESTMLSPDGTVALFQLVNERSAGTDAARKFSEGLRCVTCRDSMKLTQDSVKGTRFSYQACRQGHGRLTTFYNFLAEKQFVRELTKGERAKLAATVQQIRCSGCGAAINIGKTDACEYCRAPISVFDREAAKKAIDHYLQERQKQPEPTAGGGRRETTRPGNERWSNYDRAGLGTDILYALGRAASRGAYNTGRTVPAVGGAVGGSAASTLETFPDATSALFGDVSSGATSAASTAGNVLSGAASDVMPNATDALFGASNDAAGAVGTFSSEIANAFGDAASSGMADTAGDAVSSIAGGLLESVSESGSDAIGEVASSAGEGIIDLVSDGIGSLLGALFD